MFLKEEYYLFFLLDGRWRTMEYRVLKLEDHLQLVHVEPPQFKS